MLRDVDAGTSAGMGFGSKGRTAELGVEFFPASLGSNGMSKSRSNILLRSQSRLAESNSDNFKVD